MEKSVLCSLIVVYCSVLIDSAIANPNEPRFASLVAGSQGIHPSSEPAGQVYSNDFLRLIFIEDFKLLLNFVCKPFYYDITDQNMLVYFDSDHVAHRINKTLECDFRSVEDGDKVSYAPVPHCHSSDERTTYGVQVGYIEPASDSQRAAITVSACYDNATDVMIYARSRLLRSVDSDAPNDGRQLALDAVQLHVVDVGAIPSLELVLDSVRELEAVFNEPIDWDELPAAGPQQPAVVSARSFDAWEAYLWNGHKFGVLYLAAAASQMNARLIPLVAELQNRVQAAGQLDLYTGFVVDMEAHSELSGQMVKVPKYVWMVAVKEGETPAVVYVVANGADVAVFPDLCAANKCAAPLYCCEPSDIGQHDRIVKELFSMNL